MNTSSMHCMHYHHFSGRATTHSSSRPGALIPRLSTAQGGARRGVDDSFQGSRASQHAFQARRTSHWEEQNSRSGQWPAASGTPLSDQCHELQHPQLGVFSRARTSFRSADRRPLTRGIVCCSESSDCSVKSPKTKEQWRPASLLAPCPVPSAKSRDTNATSKFTI
jgi:hypothetical protein